MSGNGHIPKVAERMAVTCARRERMDALYFTGKGALIPLAGWHYGRGENGGKAKGMPGTTVYIVDYPFRPSAASLADMVAEHEATGEVVIYCEERWEVDPRIEEQAGPSLMEDWMLIEYFEKRVAA